MARVKGTFDSTLNAITANTIILPNSLRGHIVDITIGSVDSDDSVTVFCPDALVEHVRASFTTCPGVEEVVVS